MTEERVLGLDIGTKRTGVAISDARAKLASAFTTLYAKSPELLAKEVLTLVESEEVTRVVVGLPLNHHGEEGSDAVLVRRYIAALQKKLSVPVVEWDERFTTVQAERSLLEIDLPRKRRKEIIDKVAASVLLQSYLDHQNFSIID